MRRSAGILMFLATACTAFDAVEEDRASAPPGDAGTDGDAAPSSGADGGPSGQDAAPRDCKALSPFVDGFERENGTLSAGWGDVKMSNATLSIDPILPLAGLKSLKVDVGSSSAVRNAYLTKTLPNAACALDVKLLFRPTGFPKTFSLVRVSFAGGSRLDLVHTDGGVVTLQETSDTNETRAKTVITLTTSDIVRINLTVDLVDKAVTHAVGLLKNPAPPSEKAALAFAHGDTKSLQLGAIDSPPNQAFAFFVDDFSLE